MRVENPRGGEEGAGREETACSQKEVNSGLIRTLHSSKLKEEYPIASKMPVSLCVCADIQTIKTSDYESTGYNYHMKNTHILVSLFKKRIP